MLGHNNPHARFHKVWIVVIAFIVASLLLSGCGTQAPKMYRIGILTSNPTFTPMGDGFKAKMAELGYVENKNVTYIQETPTSDPADKQRLAKKLVDDKVDLIVTFPAPETMAAYTVTQGTNVPVVFIYAQTEGTKYIKNVREPGGNMTGVRYPGPEMITRRLEVLREIVPTVKRVWIGYLEKGPNTAATLDALRPAAEAQGITLVEVPATEMATIEADLKARAEKDDIGIDAIITMPDEFSTAAANFAIVAKFAAEHKVPVAGGMVSQAEKGALFINTTDLAKVGALAAPLADKVLKGTPVGSIPVVTPEQMLVINYNVAQELGVTVPEGLLKLADRVIK